MTRSGSAGFPPVISAVGGAADIRPYGVAMLVAIIIGLALSLCGCQRQPAEAPHLEFTRYRVNVDEKHAVARVVGEIVNRGTALVPEIEVHAVLIGAGGSERGENMVPLRDLKPGEPRTLALNITTHGSVANVQLRYQLPGRK